MRRYMGVTLALLLIIPSIVQLATTYSKPPKWHGKTGMIETDEMVVLFKDNKPWYHIWIPGGNTTAVYIVKFNRIVEFVDIDGNGVFNGTIDRVVAQALLYDVEWNVYAETINSSGIIELRITFNASVPVTRVGEGMSQNYVNVTFVNHIYSSDVEVEGIPIEGERELKIDIIIENWPWADSESKLALEIIFAGMFRGRQGVPQCECERYQVRSRYMSRVRLMGEDAGYYAEFRYQTEAKIRHNQQENMTDVGSANMFARNTAVTWLIYPHFNGTLIHDPSIYVGSEKNILSVLIDYTPLLVVVAVTATLIIIALKRRK